MTMFGIFAGMSSSIFAAHSGGRRPSPQEIARIIGPGRNRDLFHSPCPRAIIVHSARRAGPAHLPAVPHLPSRGSLPFNARARRKMSWPPALAINASRRSRAFRRSRHGTIRAACISQIRNGPMSGPLHQTDGEAAAILPIRRAQPAGRRSADSRVPWAAQGAIFRADERPQLLHLHFP